MREAIKNRISRRTFEKVHIDIQKRTTIITWINNINKLSGLTLQYIDDGSEAFKSMKKSYGMFKNVRSVILMKGLKTDINLKEKIGYYGEELILDITDLGLGTCWVAGTFDESVFNIENEEEKLICVVPVGVIKSTTIKEKAVRSIIHRKVKGIEERVISDCDLPQWAMKGMEAVLLAPSAINTQKAKFIFKDNQMRAEIINDYKCDMIDLGIAKKHFEIEAGGIFELGNGGQFNHITKN